MKRVVLEELLDLGQASPREVEASLRDLRRINRWFGGYRSAAQLAERVCRERGLQRISLLDVGAASGDVAAEVERRLRRRGIEVRSLLADLKVTHLPPGREAVAASALALPFRDASFDVVTASLLVHHLEPEQVAAFAREALRVCRHAVILNDGLRSRLHLALVYLGKPLFSRVTRHDAVASVRRAYTVPELHALLHTIPSRLTMDRHYLQRAGAILWK
jgi:SAM-dependent methyltransferase